MTPDEIRAIPTVNMQMKMQLEICAQTAELKEAILDMIRELRSQNSILAKAVKKEPVFTAPVEESPKKIERTALK